MNHAVATCAIRVPFIITFIRNIVIMIVREKVVCFIYMEKAFDRVPRKVVEWAMRKRGVPEVIVRAVMSLYEGAKTGVRVG